MYERRSMERFNMELPGRIILPPADHLQPEIASFTSNVCAGGAFFRTRRPMPVGTQVKIDLGLHSANNISQMKSLVKVSGEIIRVEKGGMAVCFNEDFIILPNPKTKILRGNFRKLKTKGGDKCTI
jgi:hypothetical protein